MMRCIDHPTMLKDGSGWGAMTGVSAAHLAAAGFTGAPALTVEDGAVAHLWSDLGERWRITEVYLKPYPVCRWAQPAIEAALQVRRRHDVVPDDIAGIEVRTFHEATRLDRPLPATTEEAQYSLPFPVAAALVHGRLAPGDITDEALADPAVRALSERVGLVDDTQLSARFPAERFAQVQLQLRDGSILSSDLLPARGDAGAPLTDDEVRAKFHALADGPLGARAASLEELVWCLPEVEDCTGLLALLLGARG
jgi:2-methylcitrate dehydratase PrpD